jgi:hypothetical protein
MLIQGMKAILNLRYPPLGSAPVVIGFIAPLNILNRASTLKENIVRYSLKMITNNILKGVYNYISKML